MTNGLLRANIEATKAFIRARLGNPYVYGGALSPTNPNQGTDCSEVWQTVLEMVHGRYQPGRQAEGATTETYRPTTMGGPVPPGGHGPFGVIVVTRHQDIPPNAPIKLAFHHGPGGGANSHMWGELDGMRIESRGGAGLITQPRAMAITDPYAHAWAYLPGPIIEDGTPVAPETVLLGRNHESYGERVRQLQEALNRAGAQPPLAVDGEFGPLTEQAVRNYQRANGLAVDGIAGPQTLGKLGLVLDTTRPPATAPTALVTLFRRAMDPTDATNARLAELLPHAAEATRLAQITTIPRAAAWWATIGHETAGLKYLAEIQTNGPGWSEERRRYRGRGAIQLTWASNYRRFGRWCADRGLVNDPEHFIAQPELVEQPRWGFLAAAWYWLHGGPKPGQINTFADAGDFLAVSRCVNGWIEGRDPVGWADRRARYLTCSALGDQLLTLADSTPLDELEGLLMSSELFQSLSHYRTDSKPVMTVRDAIFQTNAMAHERMVEDAAMRGERWAIQAVARLAAGDGPGASDPDGPFWVERAKRLLTEIHTRNPEAITAAIPGKA